MTRRRAPRAAAFAAALISAFGAEAAHAQRLEADPAPSRGLTSPFSAPPRPKTSRADFTLVSFNETRVYGPQPVSTFTDEMRRANVSLVLSAVARRAGMFETNEWAPQPRDRTVAIGGEARFVNGAGVSLVPFFGWRITDIETDACRSFVGWTSVCYDEPAVAGRRYMLLVDDDLGGSAWKTYAGVAVRLRSGVVADVAYKEFDGLRQNVSTMPNQFRQRLDERGLVFSITLPCGA